MNETQVSDILLAFYGGTDGFAAATEPNTQNELAKAATTAIEVAVSVGKQEQLRLNIEKWQAGLAAGRKKGVEARKKQHKNKTLMKENGSQGTED